MAYTYTTVPAVADGQPIVEDWGNSVVAAFDEMQEELVPAVCQVTGTTSIPSGSTTTYIAFNGETLDPLGWHAGSDTTVLPTVAGYYRCTVSASFANDTDVLRHQTAIQKNAGLSYVCDHAWESTNLNMTAAYCYSTPLIVMNGTSDTLSVRGFQTNTSAGAVNLTVNLLVELVYRS